MAARFLQEQDHSPGGAMQSSMPRIAAALALAVVGSAASANEDGKYLTILGDCAACHTEKAGEPYAGGRALTSPLGTFYTANITPDRETGIGDWSRGRFLERAPRRPQQDARTSLSRDALSALHDVFARRERRDVRLPEDASAVSHVPPENEISFPASMRSLMAIWNALYLRKGEYVPDPAKSAQWNRGAYLVKGLGHCGACHTPKNSLHADLEDLALSGNLVEDWWAADLTGDEREGLRAWSAADIVEYLKTGRNRHVMAGGSMVDIIEASTSRMRDADLEAIAAYLKDLPSVVAQEPIAEPTRSTMNAGRTQFRRHCQDCHNYDGTGVPRRYPILAGSPTVQAQDPTTILRIILEGQEPPAISARPDDDPMPAFAEKMTDEEIADVTTYMRNSWGNRAPAAATRQVQELRRKLAAEPRR